MKKNLNEFLHNQFFLMFYNPDKTLSENMDKLKEKPLLVEGFPDDRDWNSFNKEPGSYEPTPKYQSPEDEISKNIEKAYSNLEKKQKELEKKQKEEEYNRTYPNFCVASELTILPPENRTGASGVEALPDNHCYYNSLQGGIFLNQSGLSIEKFDIERINKFINQLKQKYYWEYINTVTVSSSKEGGTQGVKLAIEQRDQYVTDNLVNRFMPFLGQIASFTQIDTSGENSGQTLKFRSYFERVNFQNVPVEEGIENPLIESGGFNWFFKGYSHYNCNIYKTKNCAVPLDTYFSNPNIEPDKRNEYQKFVDEYGIWISLGQAVVMIAAAYFTGGMSLGLLGFEAGSSLIINGALAQREHEKGHNVSAGLMLVFAILPLKGLLKFAPTTSKFFAPLISRGITKADYDGLVQALSRSQLNDLSTPAQWLRWYNKQPENYRIIFNQISKGDKATWQSIAKEIAKITGKKVTGEGSEALIKALSASNKKIVELFGKAVKFTPTTLPLYKDAIKVTLAQYGGFLGLYFLTELFLGWRLNNPEPTKWVGEFVNLPTEADLILNILNAGSSENAQKMIDSLHANPQYQKVTDFITNQPNMDEGIIKAEDIMDSLLQKTYVDTTGLPYVREETKSTFVEVNISDQEIPQDGCWILYDTTNPSEEAKTEMSKIQKLDNSTYKWSKGNMYIKKQNCENEKK